MLRQTFILASTVGLLCLNTPLQAQIDSLWLANGNLIVGELKGMSRNVATIETPYSNVDLQLKWDQVRMARTTSEYLVELTNGQRLTMALNSPDTGTVRILSESDTVLGQLLEIVYMKSVKDDFWSRANASVDLGYNFTKASNLQQVNAQLILGYITDRWTTNATLNSVRSQQDGVEDIQRSELNLSYRWLLPHRFFLGLDGSFLANTEQKLNLRSSLQPTVGRFVARTNTMYFLVFAGAAGTKEDFTTDGDDRTSAEGLFGAELNLFNTGDLGLFLSAKGFPSFTETGRWRADTRFNITYDLPKDFYVRLGVNMNYDNRPVEGGSETDYSLQSGFGWKL